MVVSDFHRITINIQRHRQIQQDDQTLGDSLDEQIEAAIESIRTNKCGCECTVLKIRIVCPGKDQTLSRYCGTWKIIDCAK